MTINAHLDVIVWTDIHLTCCISCAARMIFSLHTILAMKMHIGTKGSQLVCFGLARGLWQVYVRLAGPVCPPAPSYYYCHLLHGLQVRGAFCSRSRPLNLQCFEAMKES